MRIWRRGGRNRLLKRVAQASTRFNLDALSHSRRTTWQIFPGIAHPFSRLCLSDLRHSVPCKNRALRLLARLPRHAASIRFLFVRPALCLRFPPDPASRPAPCRSANTSPCRACRGLVPPSECALPGAPVKRPPIGGRFNVFCEFLATALLPGVLPGAEVQ
jgi:hypothetical protein